MKPSLMKPSLFVMCVAMAGILGACATFQRPECSDAHLAKIEAAYIAEILRVCDGQHFDTCVERVKIDKKYDALRKEWIQCRP